MPRMKRRANHFAGPDPDFPYLSEYQRYQFPAPDDATGSVISMGGNLSPGMLLSAYEQGIFPWYNEDDPVLWQSPDPRFVIFPENLHISAFMKKVLKRKTFEVRFDTDFRGVITNCAAVYRPGQGGTWITEDMIAAYIEMYQLGYAHSAESYVDGELAGGCYGILLSVPDGGSVFFGESMFAKVSNASKAAFLTLARSLFADGVRFIDSQVYTPHVESLGGVNISRHKYLALLRDTLGQGNGETQ